jgi:hypothetical protein
MDTDLEECPSSPIAIGMIGTCLSRFDMAGQDQAFRLSDEMAAHFHRRNG